MDILFSTLQSFLQLLSDHPSVFAVQVSLIALGVIVVFLVLLATKDIMARSDSFFVQISSIVLVAILPVIGFFFYLLLRPSRTLVERRLQRDLQQVLARLPQMQQQPKKHHHEKSKKSA